MTDKASAPASRVAGALLGLAAGDALGWPAQHHRAYRLPFWTRRIRRELDAEAESTHVTRPPVPFCLNQPVEPLRLGPSDDAEWAAFTAMLLIRTKGRLQQEAVVDAWRELADRQEPVRGPVSVQGALHNLRRGVLPPQSGHDNPHYMDDAAAVRAVPIGAVCAGDPERAVHLAQREASVTNALDGLWAARAMAAAVAVAAGGGGAEEAVAAALRELPAGSWIARQAAMALSLCDGATEPLAVMPSLSDSILSPIYSYGSLAPETIPLTLALVRITRGDFTRALPVAAAFARVADSLPALVGGLCGALSGEEAIPPAWRERCCLDGVCLPELAGVHLADLARDLAGIAS